MEPTPIVPSPVVPESQRQAQDTINRYLSDTVNAMPKGTTLDGTRYIVGDGTSFCEDNPSGDDPPVRVTDWRDVEPPEGCLLYTSPSPRDVEESRMPSSA